MSPTLVYGYHPVREALRHRPHEIVRVLVAAGRGGSRRRDLEHLCRRHRVALEACPEADLDRLTGGVHNGFAAELRTAVGAEGRGGDPELLVLVEDVQDPRNLGALIRVAEGAGVGRLMIRDRGSAPLSPAVARTSAGASEWLAVERITNTASTLERLKGEGYWVYGLDPAGDPPWEVDLTGKVVLCLGGEDRGLRARSRRVCDRLLGLPMAGRVASLNLATAAAAVLYEAVRQRRGSG